MASDGHSPVNLVWLNSVSLPLTQDCWLTSLFLVGVFLARLPQCFCIAQARDYYWSILSFMILMISECLKFTWLSLIAWACFCALTAFTLDFVSSSSDACYCKTTSKDFSVSSSRLLMRFSFSLRWPVMTFTKVCTMMFKGWYLKPTWFLIF